MKQINVFVVLYQNAFFLSSWETEPAVYLHHLVQCIVKCIDLSVLTAPSDMQRSCSLTQPQAACSRTHQNSRLGATSPVIKLAPVWCQSDV